MKYPPENTVLERDYIAMEYINFIPINDPSPENTNLEDIYEEARRLTKKIHAIMVNRFG